VLSRAIERRLTELGLNARIELARWSASGGWHRADRAAASNFDHPIAE
jgi:hypothetical protein